MRKLQQFLLVNYLAFLVTKWGFVGSKCGSQVPGLLTSLPFYPTPNSVGVKAGKQEINRLIPLSSLYFHLPLRMCSYTFSHLLFCFAISQRRKVFSKVRVTQGLGGKPV